MKKKSRKWKKFKFYLNNCDEIKIDLKCAKNGSIIICIMVARRKRKKKETNQNEKKTHKKTVPLWREMKNMKFAF